MARVYELTDKGRGMEMKNQQKLVHGALLDGPRTAEQIAKEITGTLVTRQTPVKVAQFYLSVWRKEGIVKISNDASAAAPVNVEKTAEKQTITTNDIGTISAEELVDTPVSDGNDSPPVEAAAVESELTNETAPPATSELAALQQGENETLMAFMFRLVQSKPEGLWPTDVEEITAGAIRKKQAQDTLRRLMGSQHVAKTDNGYRAVSNNPYVEK